MGYYGDSLIRRFDEEPPQEWIDAIASLNDFQVQRGMRRLLAAKGGVPSLPEFMRQCRGIGDEFDQADPKPAPPLAKAPETAYDGWDVSGNVRLLKHVTQVSCGGHRPWGPPWTEQHAECTRIAVRYKHAWAQDMRESFTLDQATGELIPPTREIQDANWLECMRRAEADIAAYRASEQGKADATRYIPHGNPNLRRHSS